jgi:uncharacterized protein with HEPN domain
LLANAEGMLKLKGICMGLLVIGEEVKNLDKHSENKLLPKISTNSLECSYENKGYYCPSLF